MRNFLIVLLLVLTSCATTYKLKILPDNRIEASSRSYREFAYFDMRWNPETTAFEVVAIGVTDDTSEVVKEALGVAGRVAEKAVAIP
jgi:hypothetical protein